MRYTICALLKNVTVNILYPIIRSFLVFRLNEIINTEKNCTESEITGNIICIYIELVTIKIPNKLSIFVTLLFSTSYAY